MESKKFDPIDVRPIETDNDLAAVKEIYRTPKATLGFLPDGAFQQRADAKQIFVAFVDGEPAGYVLFAVNQRDEVRIAHLSIRIMRPLKRLTRNILSG